MRTITSSPKVYLELFAKFKKLKYLKDTIETKSKMKCLGIK